MKKDENFNEGPSQKVHCPYETWKVQHWSTKVFSSLNGILPVHPKGPGIFDDQGHPMI